MNNRFEDNEKVLFLVSRFLNFSDDIIEEKDVKNIVSSCYVSEDYAFALLLASYCGLNIEKNYDDKRLFKEYFLPMVKKLESKQYSQNFFNKHIRFNGSFKGNAELTYEKYKPYQAFVYNDLNKTFDNRVIPSLGFFGEEFIYPCIKEDGRIWMSVTPNEIETMSAPLKNATGSVLTLGLGLGYFACMCAAKPDVGKVTIVESNRYIIDLFNDKIKPQIPFNNKIEIIYKDAFAFLEEDMKNGLYNYCFADLWHDVSDGLNMYLKLKKYENKYNYIKFDYWIEKSLKCYL